VARIGIAIAAGLAALVVFVVTMWFLGDALMLWIASEGLSSVAAAGLTGLAGLVLTGLTALVARLALRPARRPALPASAGSPGVNGIAADLGALAAQQIVSTTRAHPYGTVGAALAAGLAVGAVPELRKSLLGLFKH
jgi:hypothetical protein